MTENQPKNSPDNQKKPPAQRPVQADSSDHKDAKPKPQIPPTA